MSKLALGIVAATAAAGAALVAAAPPAPLPAAVAAAPSTQAVRIARAPIEVDPPIVEPTDPPPRHPRPVDPLPPHLPPVLPAQPPQASRVIPLPLCSYDADVTSSVQLWRDYYDEEYGSAFLCQADVNGHYTGDCGSDANAASVCPASTRGRPAATHYLVRENLTGVDSAYGQGYAFADGSAVYGAYDAECRRTSASSCNDTLVTAEFHGNYIDGDYPVFGPRKVKLFDIDGGTMPYAGKVKGSVNLAWFGTCTTCGPGVGPQPNDVVLALQALQSDGQTWIDLGTKTFTSAYNTRAVMDFELGVAAGTHVRFQVRGEYAGDQPHFGYALDAATISVPVPLVGRENHLRLCEYEPAELAFDRFYRGPGAPFTCHGSLNWNGCALDPAAHPQDPEYRLRAADATSTLPPTEMPWDDGSVLHGVEEVVCHHSPSVLVDWVHQSLVKPAASTCAVSGGISWTSLAEVEGGFIEHTRPVTVVGAARLRGPDYARFVVALQVLAPDATGMLSWQDASATSVVHYPTDPDAPLLVTATVAPFSEVRLQVRGECGKEYQVLSASVFSECDPTDPFSCNP